jgi:hypothetical protein
MIGNDLVEAVLIGGYPEMLRRKDPKRRQTWARNYIRAIVQQDVVDSGGVASIGYAPELKCWNWSWNLEKAERSTKRWIAWKALNSNPLILFLWV